MNESVNQVCRVLLLGAILIDTANLTGESGRCDNLDISSANELLKRHVHAENRRSEFRDRVFQTRKKGDGVGEKERVYSFMPIDLAHPIAYSVQQEKFNQTSLGTLDLLRKDYKQWNFNGARVGISSVGVCLNDMQSKDGDFWR